MTQHPTPDTTAGSARIIDEPQRAAFRRFVPLRDYEAGNYVLSVEANAGREKVSRQVPFTIKESG